MSWDLKAESNFFKGEKGISAVVETGDGKLCKGAALVTKTREDTGLAEDSVIGAADEGVFKALYERSRSMAGGRWLTGLVEAQRSQGRLRGGG